MINDNCNYIIGLDIGIASIGWAVIEIENTKDGITHKRLLDTGVRLFNVAEVPKTKESPAKLRREARSSRRRNSRRRKRLKDLQKFFIKNGFISKQDLKSKLLNIDPYYLRYKSLHEKIEPFELAKIILHIHKRRGFKSNRKDAMKEEGGVDYGARIGELKQLLIERGYTTIGEALYLDDKFKAHKRNKNPKEDKSDKTNEEKIEPVKKTGKPKNNDIVITRQMFIDEMEMIFARQKELGNKYITEDLVTFVMHNFEQLSYAKGDAIKRRVGFCTFESGKKRAPKSSISFENFLILNKLSTLKIINGAGSRSLTTDEKTLVYNTRFDTKKLDYKKIRSLLNLDDNDRFETLMHDYQSKRKEIKEKKPETPEADIIKKVEEKVFYEPKGYKSIESALGTKDYWDTLKNDKQKMNAIACSLSWYKEPEEIVDDLKTFDSNFFDDEKIADILTISDTAFNKFGHLSITAIEKINPYFLENKYDIACEQAGYDHSFSKTVGDKLDKLQPISQEEIRNPVVIRALSQTRKVINSIIKKYGQPTLINIELAREMSKSADERKKIERTQKDNENKKLELKTELATAVNVDVNNITGEELLMYKLYKEQRCLCAYSLKPIHIKDIFSGDNLLQIDHILPQSKTWNDTFNNKVLVYTSENYTKRDRTPLEYLKLEFGEDSEKVTKFINEVQTNPNYSLQKKQALLTESVAEIDPTEFISKNLNDTRYIASHIYNLINDSLEFKDIDGFKYSKRCFTVNGYVTFTIRRFLGIQKDRAESDRHHALDAVLIALVTPSTIQRISRFVKQKREIKDNSNISVPILWNKFQSDIFARVYSDNTKEILDSLDQDLYSDIIEKVSKPMFISRMPTRKLSGKVNEDTIRSPKQFKPNYDSGLLLNNGTQAVDSGSTIRLDIYRYKNNFVAAPVYAYYINNKGLKPRVCITSTKLKNDLGMPKEERFYDPTNNKDFVFLTSIYPNDYIEISDEKAQYSGYYVKFGLATANVVIKPHDGVEVVMNKSINVVKNIKKYEVNPLGEKYLIFEYGL